MRFIFSFRKIINLYFFTGTFWKYVIFAQILKFSYARIYWIQGIREEGFDRLINLSFFTPKSLDLLNLAHTPNQGLSLTHQSCSQWCMGTSSYEPEKIHSWHLSQFRGQWHHFGSLKPATGGSIYILGMSTWYKPGSHYTFELVVKHLNSAGYRLLWVLVCEWQRWARAL